MSVLLDLDGAKAQLNKAGSSDDAELALYVEAAAQMVEGMVGPVDPRPNQVATLSIDGGAGPWLLDVFPVLSVQTLSAGGTTVDPAVLTITAAGVVTAARPLPGPLRITYTAGRDTSSVPAPMKLAARVIVAHLWKTQRGSGSKARGAEDEEGVVVGGGYAIPYMAADLLRPWQLPTAVA